MKNASSRTTYLKDYQAPAFTIVKTDLNFDLFEDGANVTARLSFRQNENSSERNCDSLRLDGQALTLQKLMINQHELTAKDYSLDADSLTIPSLSSLLGKPPVEFVLQIHTRIEPQNNTALEGLYKSKTLFCTQCEAEGFRRITYYLDRPDVMSEFSTTIVADQEKYPVLLSNGNKIDSGHCDDDKKRHWAKWHDPFRKPGYLFALVAGNLQSVDDEFITCSGRKVKLQIFVEEKDLDKCSHAMKSLKSAMKWDEEAYGREYDLDIFMIVAVDDFNMGAMENKGLNIFNTACVLANPKTTTDAAFQRVEAVVAHEYFHNWSGNRVTCRDWFQLSLKEGFTVFRDSEFSADMGSRTVKRIEDVSFLRTTQFAEDSGPMAHSVRPESYMEIANFYTVTIYEKGAEVVRMISQLLGADDFRAGSDLYFERHDGQAVTTEDFVKAMEEASGRDLSGFRNWYTQAGTPQITVSSNYDETKKQYSLKIKQYCPDTPGQQGKKPFHIPFRMGLLSESGQEFDLIYSDKQKSSSGSKETVLELTQAEQEFVFEGIDSKPIPSLLRGFSAPVKVHFDYTEDELFFLMVHDSDGFNRWNASQALAVSVIHQLIVLQTSSKPMQMSELLVTAYKAVLQSVLSDKNIDRAMVAQLLTLPALGYLIEIAEIADVDAIHKAREFILDKLAQSLSAEFANVYTQNLTQEEYRADADAIAKRQLANLCLSYLVRSADSIWLDKCTQRYYHADNMTDKLSALRILVNSPYPAAQEACAKALADFYNHWKHEPLVVDQWFSVQAACSLPDTLPKVKKLLEHEAFDIRNPNKVRSVIAVFCNQNPVGFHQSGGAGYTFLADQVLKLDKINPQIAARLLTPLTRWKKYDSAKAALMKKQLHRVKADPALSPDVFEIVEKSS